MEHFVGNHVTKRIFWVQWEWHLYKHPLFRGILSKHRRVLRIHRVNICFEHVFFFIKQIANTSFYVSKCNIWTSKGLFSQVDVEFVIGLYLFSPLLLLSIASLTKITYVHVFALIIVTNFLSTISFDFLWVKAAKHVFPPLRSTSILMLGIEGIEENGK